MPDYDDAQPGESWGYRARQTDDLVEVEVMRIGVQRPRRVLIRFVDEDFEGRQEWVPPSRLKVRWSGIDKFREIEAHWDRMWELGIGIDDPGWDAAEAVFSAFVDEDIVCIRYREGSASRIRESARLADTTGLAPDTWDRCADAFQDNFDLVVPWPVTERIAIAVARLNATALLDRVEKEERRARYEAIHGHVYRGRGGTPDRSVPPEICRETDSEIGKPFREIIRTWCGTELTG